MVVKEREDCVYQINGFEYMRVDCLHSNFTDTPWQCPIEALENLPMTSYPYPVWPQLVYIIMGGLLQVVSLATLSIPYDRAPFFHFFLIICCYTGWGISFLCCHLLLEHLGVICIILLFKFSP